MAQIIKDYGNGKFRVGASNGRRPNGTPNRKTWTIEAENVEEAMKKAKGLENEFKSVKKKPIIKIYSFNELLQEWRRSRKYKKLSPKTIERYEGMLKHKITPEFGVWPLDEIRPLDIEHFLDDVSKPGARLDKKNLEPYSDKTIQGYYILLHTLFDRAVKWKMMSENVCNNIDKPTIVKHKAKNYEDEQVDRLLECIELEGEILEKSLKQRNPNHRGKSDQEKRQLMEKRRYIYYMHKAYVYLALASSARRSEVCGLEWPDINFVTTNMMVTKTLQYQKDFGKFSTPYLKNGNDYKAMFIPEPVLEALNEYKKEQEKYKEILVDKWIETGKIFTAVNGDLINPNNISLWFKRFLKKYKLTYITLHEVRHTSIAFMLNEGIPLDVVSKIAGHSDATVTSGIYGHLLKKSKQKVVESVQTMFTRNEGAV